MQGFERMDRQLTDAAALAGHLVSAIRNVAREVPGAAEQIAQACTGHDYSKPGKPKIDWDDPEAKDALVPALVSDASAVVEAFRDAQLEEPAASRLGYPWPLPGSSACRARRWPANQLVEFPALPRAGPARAGRVPSSPRPQMG